MDSKEEVAKKIVENLRESYTDLENDPCPPCPHLHDSECDKDFNCVKWMVYQGQTPEDEW